MQENLDYIKHLENTISVLSQSIDKWKDIYKKYDIDELGLIYEENNNLKKEILQQNLKIFRLELELERSEIKCLMIEGEKLLEDNKDFFKHIKESTIGKSSKSNTIPSELNQEPDMDLNIKHVEKIDDKLDDLLKEIESENISNNNAEKTYNFECDSDNEIN